MQSDTIPVVTINNRVFEQDCVFDAWRDGISPVLDIVPRDRGKPWWADIRCYQVGDVVCNHTAYDAAIYRRTKKLMSNGDNDIYALQLFNAGSERVVTQYSTFQITPNVVVLRDSRFSCTSYAEKKDRFSITIPCHLLNTHGQINEQHPYVAWSLDTTEGRVLADKVHQVFSTVPHTLLSKAPLIAAEIIAFLNELLANRMLRDSEHMRMNRAMQLTIRRFITENLDHAELDIEMLSKQFRLSRASLYRLFQEDGGIKGFIREQRLLRCFRELNQYDSDVLRVYEVAEKYQYFNASHFNRLFKERFGVAPSEVLKQRKIAQMRDAHEQLVARYLDATDLRSWWR